MSSGARTPTTATPRPLRIITGAGTTAARGAAAFRSASRSGRHTTTPTITTGTIPTTTDTTRTGITWRTRLSSTIPIGGRRITTPTLRITGMATTVPTI